MKVLVINEGYSENLGDQAINDSLQYLLHHNEVKEIVFQDYTKKINEPMCISFEKDISNNKFLYKKIKNIIPRKIKWIIRNISRVISISKKKYDLVIIGGGQLILSGPNFPIAMISWIFFLKLFGSKNIVIFSVGSGVKFSFLEKMLYKHSFKLASEIYVRDYSSKKILRNYFDITSKVVDDVAFVHNKIQPMTNVKKEKILVGVISFSVYKSYNKENITRYEFYDRWIDILNRKKIKLEDIELFYTTSSDRVESLYFKKYVKTKYKINLDLVETNTKKILVDTIMASKIVMAARMHALILALTYKCNIITYPISDKLKSFNDMYCETFDLDIIQNNIELQLKEILKPKKENV